MSALNDQLEASRRSNASLQMRLDEMMKQQRSDGVGSDVEPVQSQADGNRSSREDEVEEESGRRNIPGQEEVVPSSNKATQRQIENLQVMGQQQQTLLYGQAESKSRSVGQLFFYFFFYFPYIV